jgi:hypothetical protein
MLLEAKQLMLLPSLNDNVGVFDSLSDVDCLQV